MKNRFLKILIVCLSIIILAIGILFIAQPSRFPESVIRNRILKETPIGSNYIDVERFARTKGWYDSSYIGNSGFMKQEAGRPYKIIGVRSIRGDLGVYMNLFDTHVTAFWGFDANDKLVDVWIWKITDSL